MPTRSCKSTYGPVIHLQLALPLTHSLQIDSFLSVLWPHDPTYFRDRLAITGALKQSLLEDFRAPLPPYVSEEDKQEFIKTFREGGFQAPTCWYKVMTRGLAAQDDQRTCA